MTCFLYEQLELPFYLSVTPQQVGIECRARQNIFPDEDAFVFSQRVMANFGYEKVEEICIQLSDGIPLPTGNYLLSASSFTCGPGDYPDSPGCLQFHGSRASYVPVRAVMPLLQSIR